MRKDAYCSSGSPTYGSGISTPSETMRCADRAVRRGWMLAVAKSIGLSFYMWSPLRAPQYSLSAVLSLASDYGVRNNMGEERNSDCCPVLGSGKWGPMLSHSRFEEARIAKYWERRISHMADLARDNMLSSSERTCNITSRHE